jgi:hypothetical protein
LAWLTGYLIIDFGDRIDYQVFWVGERDFGLFLVWTTDPLERYDFVRFEIA